MGLLMNEEQRNKIMLKFLTELNTSPAPIHTEQLINYPQLAQALQFLEQNAQHTIEFDNIQNDASEWAKLTNILRDSLNFVAGAVPLQIANVSEQSLRDGIAYYQRHQLLQVYPQCDYYNRHTTTFENLELRGLIHQARENMRTLLGTFQLQAFDPSNHKSVEHAIASLEKQHKKLPINSPELALIESKLVILNDLNKLNKLTNIHIPDEQGGLREYCSLEESAGGVTEKVSLVSLDSVRSQLRNLIAAREQVTSIANYMASRDEFKLRTEAILKLPKAGKEVEVLREAMALSISRILQIDTTNSIMVTHNQHPALFVPFENIRLLQDYAKGTILPTATPQKPYQDDSILIPVGEGLQGDKFIDDFGPSLGLFYLCSDPDAIGGFNQNKALRNDQSLYVFDQVVKPSNFLALDSRLSMHPDTFLGGHIRHWRGRNKSLIEDAPLTSKFASLMDIKQNQVLILQYASNTITRYQHRIGFLKDLKQQAPLPPHMKKELESLQVLVKDMEQQKHAIVKRIQDIDKVLPKHEEGISNVQIRQALVLEKLMNHPVLFTHDGRPYKNPWTNSHHFKIESIALLPGDANQVSIKCNETINVEMMKVLNQHGAGLRRTAPNTFTIDVNDLERLNEYMVFPENHSNLHPRISYLNTPDLTMLYNAYKEPEQARSLNNILYRYQNAMLRADTPAAKIALLERTESLLVKQEKSGLSQHVLKKFYFEMQQQLQLMVPPEYSLAKVNAAFAAALKLDRISEFNQVMKESISYHLKAASSQHAIEDNILPLDHFLNQCIAAAAPALTHRQAMLSSADIQLAGTSTLSIYHDMDIAAEQALVNEALINIDPLAQRTEELAQERALMLGEPIITAEAPLEAEVDTAPSLVSFNRG